MTVKEFLDLYLKDIDLRTVDGIKLRTIHYGELSLNKEMPLLNGDILRAGKEIYEIKIIDNEVSLNQLTTRDLNETI